MTNDEAINVLKNAAYIGATWIGDEKQFYDFFDAVKMAVEALKTQLPKEDTTSDCISRQAALELGDNLRDDLPDDEQIAAAVMAHNEGIIEYQTKLSLLPSVQPEIIRCKDCKYGKQDQVGRWFCQIGNEDGSGFCADAERRTDERTDK